MPAEKAGLEPGDQIIEVDDLIIDNRSQLISALHDRYNKAIYLTVLRGGERVELLITPVKQTLEGGDAYGFIGVQFDGKDSTPEILVKYSITQSEYDEVVSQLSEKLSFGSCGLCV